MRCAAGRRGLLAQTHNMRRLSAVCSVALFCVLAAPVLAAGGQEAQKEHGQRRAEADAEQREPHGEETVAQGVVGGG